MHIDQTKRVWFTSDTHYDHTNLVKGETSWQNTDQCRDFTTTAEMNEAIVDGINSVVMPEDILFHNGDWSFGGADRVLEFRRKIQCKTVHLIRGNHDRHIKLTGRHAEGFSSVSDYLKVDYGGIGFVMSHYPMKSWHHSYYGTWMLFGHCHGNLRQHIPTWMLKQLMEEERWQDLRAIANDEVVEGIYPHGFSMDIGVDTHPEFKPYSFEEIKAYMERVKASGMEKWQDRL